MEIECSELIFEGGSGPTEPGRSWKDVSSCDKGVGGFILGERRNGHIEGV